MGKVSIKKKDINIHVCVCVFITDSFCDIPETNTVNQLYYRNIKTENKKTNKKSWSRVKKI